MHKPITFLFWNINNNDLSNNIARIAKIYEVDIIILAECNISDSLILNKFKEDRQYYVNKSRIPKHRIKVFSRFSDQNFSPFLEDPGKKLTIRKLKLTDTNEILVAALHLISKLNFNEDDQSFEAQRFSQEIIDAERAAGHKNTIVVGDFNMNPFEKGMIVGNCFNTIMSREIAKKEKRRIQGKDYIYFYNPMWKFFTDLTDEPIGTYYYNRNKHINYQWNIFDQILIRPSLVDKFDTKKIMILDNDGDSLLVDTEGIPDKKNGSDHLPILFSLNLQ